MPQLKENKYTVNDIYNLPEGERAELIDGNIYMMAPPSTGHQRIIHFLDMEIGKYIQDKGGKCEVFPAPFAVFLNEDASNYVEPDISVVCDPGKINNRGCNGAPDWVIEIVSPSSRRMDYMIKLFKYRTAGVREYWIIDPSDKSITVYNFSDYDIGKYNFSDSVKAGIYDDLELDFSTLNI